MTWWSNLRGTASRLFGVGQATFDADAMTAARMHALPDKSGTLAHTSDIPATLDYLDPNTTSTAELIDALIANGWMAGPTPAVPSNVSPPTITGGSTVGSLLTVSNGAWTGSPTSYAHQWQEEIAAVWTDITGQTGDTYEPDHAGSFRVEEVATNGVGSSAPTYSASKTISVPSTLPPYALRLAGDVESAVGTVQAGGGDAPFTILALAYIEPGTRGDYRNLIANLFDSGRVANLLSDNAFEVHNLSISNNQGDVIPFSPDLASGGWALVSLAGDAGANTAGIFRGTYQELDGPGTLVSVQWDKGDFFGTPDGVAVQLGAGNTLQGYPSGVRFQWVRAYGAFMSTSEIEDVLTSGDPSGALFWWEFDDNGVGGVAVSDLTGNGIVPTLTGGTLVDGPGA